MRSILTLAAITAFFALTIAYCTGGRHADGRDSTYAKAAMMVKVEEYLGPGSSAGVPVVARTLDDGWIIGGMATTALGQQLPWQGRVRGVEGPYPVVMSLVVGKKLVVIPTKEMFEQEETKHPAERRR